MEKEIHGKVFNLTNNGFFWVYESKNNSDQIKITIKSDNNRACVYRMEKGRYRKIYTGIIKDKQFLDDILYYGTIH